jgi:hypothetical protein
MLGQIYDILSEVNENTDGSLTEINIIRQQEGNPQTMFSTVFNRYLVYVYITLNCIRGHLRMLLQFNHNNEIVGFHPKLYMYN